MNTLRSLSILTALLCLLFTAGCQESFDYQPAPTRPNGKLSVNIMTYLRSRPDAFSLLVQALERADLATTLSGGTYTLFAPDDVAFKAYLGNRTLESIPVEDLKRILLFHVINRKLLSSDLSLDLVPYPSQLTGRNLTLSRNATFVITVNGNRVFVSNLEPTNGAIHVIPRVLVP